MSKRLWVLIGSVVLVACLGAAFWITLRPGKAEEIRVGYMRISSHVPVIAAADESLGFFKKHGLKVVLEQFPDTPALMKGLEAGRIDIAYQVTPDILWTAGASGRQYYTCFVVQSTKEAPIDGVYAIGDVTSASLGGKVVGCFPGPTAMGMTKAIMKAVYGLEAGQYELQPVPPPLQISSLKSGKIAALFTYEPLGTLAVEHGGAKRVLRAPVEEHVIDPWTGGVGLLSKRLAMERRETSKAFIKAVRESVDHLVSHPELMAKMTVELQPGMDLETAKKVPFQKHIFADSTGNVAAIRDYLSKQLPVYQKLGIVGSNVNQDVQVFSGEQ